MGIEKIGIVGAGVMGCDVALNLALFGYHVTLNDLTENILIKAKDKIAKGFKVLKMLNKDIPESELDNMLDKIEFTTDLAGFDKIEFCIENITEDLMFKKELWGKLNNICNGHIICAINTSCISITEMSSFIKNPNRVIGMHFMNPVPLNKLVEVSRGFHTSEDVIEKSKDFLKSIKKVAIIINDSPGFVSNRLSHLLMNEAAFLVHENVSNAKDIDNIFKIGYGHKMGPLETADLIGLDTVVNSLDVLYKSFQDPKFRCCPLLKKMVNAGLLGKKSGKGFYNYEY